MQTVDANPAPDPEGWRVPSQCEVCRSWGDARICQACVLRFVRPGPRCARCGLRLGGGFSTCGSCLREPPPFASTLCATDYQFPWDRLIAAFKFQNQPELAAPLVACMLAAIRAWQQASPGAPMPQVLLPVPLAAPRLAQRGYNQAWELTRRLGRTLQLQARPDLLSRALDTAHQAELGREQRQRNLRSAFLAEPAKRATLQGLHVALVDDVMTTGATVAEAAHELLRSGASRVDVWVLARTPDPLGAGRIGA